MAKKKVDKDVNDTGSNSKKDEIKQHHDELSWILGRQMSSGSDHSTKPCVPKKSTEAAKNSQTDQTEKGGAQ